jgi:hypothetical protein
MVSFNWSFAQKNSDMPVATAFVCKQSLKSGSLYQCRFCDTYWYLDADESFMYHVTDQDLPRVLDWNAQEFALTTEQYSALEQIGAASCDIGISKQQNARIPCRITTHNGQVFDYAVVSIQNHPPLIPFVTEEYFFATDIVKIEPSPYALPLSVRRAAIEAEEIRMCFAPTVILLPNGDKLVLNDAEDFFVQDGVDTTQIVVSSDRDDPYAFPIYQFDQKITCFIADR